jgi:maleate cis-trans isomerase
MGARKRLGVLVPATNSVAEPDFNRAVPDDVTVHSHRLWLQNQALTDEAIDRMNSDIEAGAEYLAQAKVDVIAVAATFNTFYKGPEWPLEMERNLSAAVDTPTVLTSPSVVFALRTLGAHSISVATPYPDFANKKLRVYFESNGFQVLNVDGDPSICLAGTQEINEHDPREIAKFAATAARPEADALFLPCTAWRTLEVADELERRLGKPVVTSSQATIWRCLLAAGVERRISGRGRLLADMPALVA